METNTTDWINMVNILSTHTIPTTTWPVPVNSGYLEELRPSTPLASGTETEFPAYLSTAQVPGWDFQFTQSREFYNITQNLGWNLTDDNPIANEETIAIGRVTKNKEIELALINTPHDYNLTTSNWDEYNEYNTELTITTPDNKTVIIDNKGSALLLAKELTTKLNTTVTLTQHKETTREYNPHNLKIENPQDPNQEPTQALLTNKKSKQPLVKDYSHGTTTGIRTEHLSGSDNYIAATWDKPNNTIKYNITLTTYWGKNDLKTIGTTEEDKELYKNTGLTLTHHTTYGNGIQNRYTLTQPVKLTNPEWTAEELINKNYQTSGIHDNLNTITNR